MTDDSLFAYGETAGFVNIPASRDRAVEEARAGTFSVRAHRVLDFLVDKPAGLTWREVGNYLSLHHGQVSGALSNLHRKGHVFMLRDKRDRCHPYVHSIYRDRYRADERIDEPSETQAGRQRNLERQILDGLADLDPSDITLYGGRMDLLALIFEYQRLRRA